MAENGRKYPFREFVSKYIFVKPKAEEKQTLTPKQFVFSILSCVMFFICLTVLKLPYNRESAMILNCYYGLLFLFVMGCYLFNACENNSPRQKKILLFLKIVTLLICCIGIYLYASNYDYIDKHISKWGSFNKVR